MSARIARSQPLLTAAVRAPLALGHPRLPVRHRARGGAHLEARVVRVDGAAALVRALGVEVEPGRGR